MLPQFKKIYKIPTPTRQFNVIAAKNKKNSFLIQV